MTAGVAHEVLNPLSVISGRVQLLLLKRDLPHDLEKVCRILQDQVGRIKQICDGMVQFARQKEPTFQRTDLRGCLAQALGLIGSELQARQIAVHTAFDPEFPPIQADEEQLHQVFLHLLTNAMDAMPEGGSIRVEARAGDPVRVTLADTGCGISPEHLPRIFDPFFSTKDMGMGLGLAVTHGIIAGHAGTIRVESLPGAGTTVTIELPQHP
jgi:signal transduction histidine kinase